MIFRQHSCIRPPGHTPKVSAATAMPRMRGWGRGGLYTPKNPGIRYGNNVHRKVCWRNKEEECPFTRVFQPMKFDKTLLYIVIRLTL